MNNVQSIPTSGEWLTALFKSANDFAQTSLNLDGCQTSGSHKDIPLQDAIGAYVPWVNEFYSIQLAFLSSEAGCERIAKMLLCMEPDEEITFEDMTDALQEIMNILAGMAKGIVGGAVAAKNMGLPVFINSYINLNHQQEALAEPVMIGDIPCYLVILHVNN